MKETYRCWAEIDRSALHHNAKTVRERIGSAEMLAVVKANAYGHGLIGVAETLAGQVQLFGVANLQEALKQQSDQLFVDEQLVGATREQLWRVAGYIARVADNIDRPGELAKIGREVRALAGELQRI